MPEELSREYKVQEMDPVRLQSWEILLLCVRWRKVKKNRPQPPGYNQISQPNEVYYFGPHLGFLLENVQTALWQFGSEDISTLAPTIIMLTRPLPLRQRVHTYIHTYIFKGCVMWNCYAYIYIPHHILKPKLWVCTIFSVFFLLDLQCIRFDYLPWIRT